MSWPSDKVTQSTEKASRVSSVPRTRPPFLRSQSEEIKSNRNKKAFSLSGSIDLPPGCRLRRTAWGPNDKPSIIKSTQISSSSTEYKPHESKNRPFVVPVSAFLECPSAKKQHFLEDKHESSQKNFLTFEKLQRQDSWTHTPNEPRGPQNKEINGDASESLKSIEERLEQSLKTQYSLSKYLEGNPPKFDRPKYTGYKPQNGFCFIPFSKMFTKAGSAPLSRRSSSTELSVANCSAQLSPSEQLVISKTRRALKERLNSAHRKTNEKQKVHLNIFFNQDDDTDEETGTNARALQDNPIIKPTKKKKRPKKSATIKCSGEKDEGIQESSAKPPSRTVRRPASRKDDVVTLVSEISPTNSDEEAGLRRRPKFLRKKLDVRQSERKFDQLFKNSPSHATEGQLLHRMISDLHHYKCVPDRVKSMTHVHNSASNRLQVEVRIDTSRKDGSSSSSEDANDTCPFIRAPRSKSSLKKGRRGWILMKNILKKETKETTETLSKDKLWDVLEACSAKEMEARHIQRKLALSDVFVSLDTINKGLMTPTEWRVYRENFPLSAKF